MLLYIYISRIRIDRTYKSRSWMKSLIKEMQKINKNNNRILCLIVSWKERQRRKKKYHLFSFIFDLFFFCLCYVRGKKLEGDVYPESGAIRFDFPFSHFHVFLTLWTLNSFWKSLLLFFSCRLIRFSLPLGKMILSLFI